MGKIAARHRDLLSGSKGNPGRDAKSNAVTPPLQYLQAASNNGIMGWMKPSDFTTTSLSYPLNVEGDSQLGHYIMFFINKIDPGALQAAGGGRRRAEQIIAELGSISKDDDDPEIS